MSTISCIIELPWHYTATTTLGCGRCSHTLWRVPLWDGIRNYLLGLLIALKLWPTYLRILALLVILTHVIYLTRTWHVLKQVTSRTLQFCWRSTKELIVATSSYHAKILALHKATCECFWLRFVMEHIWSTVGLSTVLDVPTTIFEDSAACIVLSAYSYTFMPSFT